MWFSQRISEMGPAQQAAVADALERAKSDRARDPDHHDEVAESVRTWNIRGMTFVSFQGARTDGELDRAPCYQVPHDLDTRDEPTFIVVLTDSGRALGQRNNGLLVVTTVRGNVVAFFSNTGNFRAFELD